MDEIEIELDEELYEKIIKLSKDSGKTIDEIVCAAIEEALRPKVE